jgi:hypothetical protein
VLMKPLRGNSSDSKEFGHIVREHIAQLQTTYGTTYLVADSARYRTTTCRSWQPPPSSGLAGCPRP